MRLAFDGLGIAAPHGVGDVLLAKVSADLDTFHTRVEGSVAASGRRPVALMGDSLVRQSFPMHRAHEPSLSVRIERALRTKPKGRGVDVVPLTWGGQSLLDWYYLADAVAGSGARNVLLALDLSTLQPFWKTFDVPNETAAWLAVDRIPSTLFVPLHRFGLTTDRLLLYVALRKLGLIGAWIRLKREQTRAEQLRFATAEALDPDGKEFARLLLTSLRGGPLPPPGPRPNRGSREFEIARYGAVLNGIDPDDPMLRVLSAALRDFRDRGVAVLVVVMPANVEHWRAVGVGGIDTGLPRSLRTLRTLVVGAGATFVDMHGLLRDADFRDKTGHLAYVGDLDAYDKLTDAVTPLVSRWLSRERP